MQKPSPRYFTSRLAVFTCAAFAEAEQDDALLHSRVSTASIGASSGSGVPVSFAAPAHGILSRQAPRAFA